MKSIVKLEWNNELKVQESIKIIDHSSYYEVDFGTFANDITNKDLYNSIPYVEIGTWKNTLYVTGTKYHKNPQYWISLVKTWREKSDCRKWLKSC